MTETPADRLAAMLTRRADAQRAHTHPGLVLHPERWCTECREYAANQGGPGTVARLCPVCADEQRRGA